MHAGQKISRRDFVKTSVVAGGALLASTVMPGQAKNLSPQGQEGNPKFTDDGLVKGVCDIHLHLRPDSRERSADEYGFMQDAMRAGYRAVMFKSNDFSCHDRAYLIRQAQPEAECFGSFCMNRVHGDRVNRLPRKRLSKQTADCAAASGCRHLTLHTTTNVKAEKIKASPCWMTTDRCCPKSSA